VNGPQTYIYLHLKDDRNGPQTYIYLHLKDHTNNPMPTRVV
jgi:hypothetical protein